MGFLERFRRARFDHYGDCPVCGHDWREHPPNYVDEPPCSECVFEVEHGERAQDEPLCIEWAPPRPTS